MRRTLLLAISLVAYFATALADGVHFTYDPSEYEQQTVVYAAFVDNLGTRINDTSNTYYLAAFINGECRYEAMQQFDAVGNTFFTLIVGGNASEIGKRITFKVYKTFEDPTGAPVPGEDSGTEYWLDESQYTTFNGDDRTSEVSNPLLLTFVPVSWVNIDPIISVYKGQSVDLTTFIQKESYETLPQLTWDGSQGQGYYTIEGNILTAVEKTEGAGAIIECKWGENSTIANVQINVMATKAVFADKYRKGITVPVGDTDLITEALTEGVVLTPTDATTTFNWESNKPKVVDVSATDGRWTALKVGTATLTGTATDDSGLSLSLKVTVVQPVTTINLSERMIYVEVGTDITDMLNDLVSVYPETASNQEVIWSVDPGYSNITWSNGRFIAAEETGNSFCTMTVTAQDGFGAEAQLYVSIVPVSPKTFKAKKATIYLTNDPANPNADCTDDIMANFVITPDGLDIYDYTPEFESEDEDIIQVNYSPAGLVTFNITGTGETTIYASIFYNDYSEFDATGAPSEKQLDASFKVVVKDGLSGFAFDDVDMTKDETYTLTLTPQPAGSEYDASKISVEISVSGRTAFPDAWTFVDVTPVSGSKGLKYTLDAKSVGAGEINVIYDGNVMGYGEINVGQRLKLTDGWQWIALYEGVVSSVEEMEEIFGDNFSDLRSQEAILINDSQLGYFGDLTSMENLQTYKLKLTGVGDDVIEYGLFNNTYMYIADSSTGKYFNMRKGWNWIGNPYQYYQKLTDVLTADNFTKNDWVKSKTQSATYDGTTWTGTLTHLTPGEGILLYTQKEGTANFKSEYTLNQNETAQAAPRKVQFGPEPWTFDHRKFEDNMAMVAKVCNVNNPEEVTVWAFVGDECRGRGEVVGDLQFITVHGIKGEKVKFRLYDNMTGQFHEVLGSFTLSDFAGTCESPVPLFEGQVTAIEDVNNADFLSDGKTYDLSGRMVTRAEKGIYIKDGKKIVVK